MPWITEPAAWLRASAGAAILPTAMPVCTLSTRTWPSQVSTSTSITCTELGTPAPIAMLEKRRIIQPKMMPMKPASLQRRANARRGRLAVLRRTPDGADIGRGRDHLAPRRIGAGRRLALCILLDRGLQLLDRQQRRRHHRGGGAAAARARAFRQIGIADAHLDLMRLQTEFARHRIGDHGAAACADILGRGAGDRGGRP